MDGEHGGDARAWLHVAHGFRHEGRVYRGEKHRENHGTVRFLVERAELASSGGDDESELAPCGHGPADRRSIPEVEGAGKEASGELPNPSKEEDDGTGDDLSGPEVADGDFETDRAGEEDAHEPRHDVANLAPPDLLHGVKGAEAEPAEERSQEVRAAAVVHAGGEAGTHGEHHPEEDDLHVLGRETRHDLLGKESRDKLDGGHPDPEDEGEGGHDGDDEVGDGGVLKGLQLREEHKRDDIIDHRRGDDELPGGGVEDASLLEHLERYAHGGGGEGGPHSKGILVLHVKAGHCEAEANQQRHQ
mmetsp:Transcript_17201/g.55034  ORF Transcript_17201/g.55034 Transcript_17201/m.55034 type:complete len:303 (-) Transcript_17201:531-1439(-)